MISKRKMRKTKIFSGSSHPELASAIADRYVSTQLNIPQNHILYSLSMPQSPIQTQTYPNHELSLYLTSSVRNDDVFLIQSGSDTINDHLMELLVMVQACRMASAGRITAVVPYFPYGKWSKKKRARGPITAKRTPLPTAYIYIYIPLLN